MFFLGSPERANAVGRGGLRLSRRALFATGAVALVVSAVEFGATYASVGADPMAMVDGWAPARPGDAWALVLAAVGCGALFAVLRFPAVAMVVTASAYGVFVFRDYEFGMTLPAMVAIVVLAANGRQRVLALVGALACLAASLAWVANRTVTVSDEGVALLSWVAFGTVSAVFFLAPLAIGEHVRLRRLLRTSCLVPAPSAVGQ